jgi:hypothetical protein
VQFSPQLEDTIQKASDYHGVPPSTLRAFAAIESGGNPRARTGSYFGVYQLSHSEFRKYGGRGSIFDPSENTKVAARKLRAEADAFSRQYGREPTATEFYMLHQQGVTGAATHMANPEAPAWQNTSHRADLEPSVSQSRLPAPLPVRSPPAPLDSGPVSYTENQPTQFSSNRAIGAFPMEPNADDTRGHCHGTQDRCLARYADLSVCRALAVLGTLFRAHTHRAAGLRGLS